MAKLKAATRNKIPSSEFGLPGSRKYPMEDREHAILAKGRAKQMLKKDKISESTYEKIRRKAKSRMHK